MTGPIDRDDARPAGARSSLPPAQRAARGFDPRIDARSPFARGFVGVGLGIDVHSEQPDWRALLRSDLPFDFFEVYTRGTLEGAREVRTAADAVGLPLLYHDDDLDPILPGGPRSDAMALARDNHAATGAPWCVSELATRRVGVGGRYLDFFQPILLTEEAARAAAESLRTLDRALPGRIVAENPPYQLPVGPLHILEVMARAIVEADVPCVLDLGHLYSFQLCRGLDPLHGLDAFPLERIIELHVAGATIDARWGATLYHDAHGGEDIPPRLLTMLAEVAPRCPNLRAVTIEVEDAPLERVADQLERTRAAVGGLLAARPPELLRGRGRPEEARRGTSARRKRVAEPEPRGESGRRRATRRDEGADRGGGGRGRAGGRGRR